MTLPRARRELHSSGRHLVHMHLGIAEVFGNSSSLMYYYTNLYVGDHENLSTQALILDTGSGITWFPCKDMCPKWGSHINSYYDVSNSNTVEYLNCKKDDCSWVKGDKCFFHQSYGEGSLYKGFWIKENVYLDSQLHSEDKLKFTVGCVTDETNYFKTQKADGNLLLTVCRHHGTECCRECQI